MKASTALLVLTVAFTGCSESAKPPPTVQDTSKAVSQPAVPIAAAQDTAKNGAGAPGHSIPPEEKAVLLEELSKQRSDVRWESGSLLSGDFDGDGNQDRAALGYVGDGFVIAIGNNTEPGSYAWQFLPFGINGTDEAATCGPTIKLEALPLACAPESDDSKLPGCVEFKGATSLTAGSGECDPINLYWDHDKHHMTWWRN